MYNANQEEQEILKFWESDQTFEKSIIERPENKPYHFYDGPPFATGLPHYGHIVASLMKDVVPRYWTMRGFRVERKWGWDCHGLPIENIIEEELNLKSKKDIEDYGIANFNEACRCTVLRYAEEWKKTIQRMGRWVDMSVQDGSVSGEDNYGEHGYRTMDMQFMESVWWVFRQLWDKGLIYEGKKPMHICPRCVTPLSNFEVTQGYKDVKDITATAKFKLKNTKEKLGIDSDVYILAWTTTPWTLPGNVALAVGKEIEYVLVEFENINYLVAKSRAEEVLKDIIYKIIKEFKGDDLVGLEYEPLFPYFADTENAFRVCEADFVTTEDGTGIVHIAPAFGEDDYNLGQREKIGWVQHVGMDGKFTKEVVDFADQEVKPREEPTRTDVEIIKYLAHKGLLFSKEKVEHSYPHCWRCDTPLLNYATSSWFVRVTELKDLLLKNNLKINWVPDHIKEGRFGKWLEGARDWAISRNRFWGTPLPVWKCQSEISNSCDNMMAIGSVIELEKLTGEKITDLHKHKIDHLVFKCEKCGGEMKRISEVLDCWFESGAMPYGQMHYPFENKTKFESSFPAEFIAEGQDQTRGWFYTLHILATALTAGNNPIIPVKESEPAFKNVIVNGIVLAEDGKKMSKRLKNYPDPIDVLEKYGADAMRYYLVSSPVMYAESLNFSEKEVREMYNKVVNTLWNVFTFYDLFSSEINLQVDYKKSNNILDQWILVKLNLLVKEVTEKMNEYKLAEAARPILDFIDELSTWYVRRSRDRFKGDDLVDKQFALVTLREVLIILSKVMAPFTPFIAENVYQKVSNDKNSVHLQIWPEVQYDLIKEKVLKDMDIVRKVVNIALAIRKEQGISVRQPLNRLLIYDLKLKTEFKQIIAEELNVKNVEVGDGDESLIVKEEGDLKVGLDIQITPELKKEGLVREIVRAINQIRKEQSMTIDDEVRVEYTVSDELLIQVLSEYAGEIKKSVLAKELKLGTGIQEVKIGGKPVLISVIKI